MVVALFERFSIDSEAIDLIPTIPLLLSELRRGDRDRAARALLAATIGAIERLNPTNQLVISNDVCGKALMSAKEVARRQLPDAFVPSIDWTASCSLWQERFAVPSTYRPVQSDKPTLILTAEFRRSNAYGIRFADRRNVEAFLSVRDAR